MFGKKKKIPAEDVAKESLAASTHVQTIPDAFYGGADPLIYHPDAKVPEKKGEETIIKTPVKPPIVSTSPAGTQPVATKTAKKGNIPPKKKWPFYVGVGVFFLVAILGISWYYLRPQIPPTEKKSDDKKFPVIVTTTTEIKELPTVATSTPTSTSTEVPMADTKAAFNFPRLFLTSAVDLDNDHLTDIEEEIYRTDSGTWDTDIDGYYDGQEVVNLYNPAGTAPEKIIDSGLVREYVHPAFGYRLYYPGSWEADAVDSASQEVLLSAITGDYISVHTFPRTAADTFESWFAQSATGQNYSDLVPASNRFKVDFWKRKDGLVSYFMTSDAFFVFIYHPGQTETVLYPTVMDMTLQSFRPKATTTDLPVQPVLPTSTFSDVEITSSSLSTSTP